MESKPANTIELPYKAELPDNDTELTQEDPSDNENLDGTTVLNDTTPNSDNFVDQLGNSSDNFTAYLS